MTTVAERKKIAELVLNTTDEDLLEKIKELTLSHFTATKEFISEYNREIEEAVERIQGGKFKTQEEVDALLNLWESK
ncbi:MAG: hypothetical protein CFE21_03390 [Bacteroidetes bacterium B1(2017)]|nr:MAG: hypothetical protein CFE21_03390 [Bacteroidetes bacterium B1(2017)]